MKAEHIMAQDNFQKCLDFHGHLCPGLAIGYRAASGALEWLKENRSEDEELVAIVETDACGADAVQVLTGCTFGKGNFLYKDHGKQVLSLISRRTGQGVRVALKAGAFQPSERHQELIDKIRTDTATDEEIAEFRQVHRQRSCQLLEVPLEELFSLSEVTVPVPEKAKIESSKICDVCGEPTMGSKISVANGKSMCRDCAASSSTV
jgi:formylmethanofuran dehydrogenase subunit E